MGGLNKSSPKLAPCSEFHRYWWSLKIRSPLPLTPLIIVVDRSIGLGATNGIGLRVVGLAAKPACGRDSASVPMMYEHIIDPKATAHNIVNGKLQPDRRYNIAVARNV